MSEGSFRSDVLVLGAGVVGLTTALKLAENGVKVTLCDHQAAGQEASWAGAGMLPPGNLQYAATPEARLRSFSGTLWPEFSQQLQDTTSIDNGFRICGAVEFFDARDSAALQLQLDCWQHEHVNVELLNPADVAQRIGCANPNFAHACYLPDFGQVRNPRHLKALIRACRQSGVSLVEHTGPLRLNHASRRIESVQSLHHHFEFDALCLTAGAWTTALLEQVGLTIPVKPIRGQILLLQHCGAPFHSIIELGRRYLVPRPDGLVLAGSTEEDSGFEKRTTAEGVRQLTELVVQLCPALRNAELLRSWAGLRPASLDELPLIGRVPGFDNLWVGTGHFRSGLQMSVGTAAILSQLITGQSSPIDMQGLHADRFLRDSATDRSTDA